MGRVVNVTPSENDGDFKPIPTGTKLVATVFAIEESTVRSEESVNFGKAQLDVTFKVQGGEFSGREIRYQKIPLYDGPAAWKLTSFAEAVGWPRKDGNVELPDNISSILGTALTIKVREDAPNAKKQVFNSVIGYAPVGVGEAAAVSSANSAPSWAGLNGS